MKTKIVLLSILLLAGCKDSEMSQLSALGSKHKITVYSGGVAVKVYHSTGSVSNEANSDGWYFEDADTKKLVEVAGTLVIEQE